MNDKLQKKSS